MALYSIGPCFYHRSHPQLGVVILSGVTSSLISSSILGIYRPGKFIFQCHIFLPFHTVHGVCKTRILKWFPIPFSSGPHSVRPLHHDPSILSGPTLHGLVSLSWTRLWSVWSVWLVVCDCGSSLSALWCPLPVPSVLLGFLLPWMWGRHGVSPLGHHSWPWTWGISSCHRSWPWTWGVSSQLLLHSAAAEGRI